MLILSFRADKNKTIRRSLKLELRILDTSLVTRLCTYSRVFYRYDSESVSKDQTAATSFFKIT